MATSYANPGGSGDRRVSIDMRGTIGFRNGNGFVWINGALNSGVWFTSGSAGQYVDFDFGEPRVIDEAKYYQDSARAQGSWQISGSLDGVTYTPIGGAFTMGQGAAQYICAELHGNTTAYRYYRWTKLDGSWDDNSYQYGMEFQIDEGTSNNDTWLSKYGFTDKRPVISTAGQDGVAGPNAGLDGVYGADCYWLNGRTASFYQFNLDAPACFIDAKYIQDSDSTQGSFIWQGSNDGDNWTDIGAAFVLGKLGNTYNDNRQYLNELNANTINYLHYKLKQVSGTTTSGPNILEISFKVGTGSGGGGTTERRRQLTVVS